MARILPARTEAQLRQLQSPAEAAVYRALRALPDSYVILHQLDTLLPGRDGLLREGEVDFLILHPSRGLLVLEVKGGGIEHHVSTGEWWSIDRNGTRHPIRDPFHQARTRKHALLDYVRGHIEWQRHGNRFVPICYAVLFADLDSLTAFENPSRPAAILGDRAALLHIQAWIDGVFDAYTSLRPGNFSPAERDVVASIVCKDLRLQPRLSVHFQREDEQRAYWTEEQWKIVKGLRQNRITRVEGAAGTGKTLLAVRWAQEAALASQKVLLMCFNRPLAQLLKHENLQFLRKHALPLDAIGMMSYHDFALYWLEEIKKKTKIDWLKETKQSFPGQSEADVQIPHALAFAMEEQLPPYDVLVVDEAQDFGAEYWGSLEPLICSRKVAIFHDPNQAIYRQTPFPFDAARYSLTQNCRNTAAIHTSTFRFYKGPEVSPPELQGQEVRQVSGADKEAQVHALVRLTRDLIEKEGLQPHDIAILVQDSKSKNQAYSALTTAFSGVIPLSVEEHFIPGRVLCETVARYKGLEALVVIIWLNRPVKAEDDKALLYVGLSRARSLLCLVGTQQDCNAVLQAPAQATSV